MRETSAVDRRPRSPAAPAARPARQAFASRERDRSRCGSANSRRQPRQGRFQTAVRAARWSAPRRRGARCPAHRAWRALWRAGSFFVFPEKEDSTFTTVTQRYPIFGRHHPRKRVIQYSSTFVMESRSRGVLDTPLEPVIGLAQRRDPVAEYDGFGEQAQRQKEKCEAAMAVGALDPGVPYESRWAPCDRIHGPGQGQFPEGSIRPRGYMAPDARRSFAPPM